MYGIFSFKRPKLELGIGAGSGDDLVETVNDDAANGTSVGHFFSGQSACQKRAKDFNSGEGNGGGERNRGGERNGGG